MKYFLGLFFVMMVVCTPLFASAQDAYGIQGTADSAGITKFGASPQDLIAKVLGAGLAMIGVVFFILVVYGGILWMTARGAEDQVEKGRDAVIQASVGLIIVVAAYALTAFVFKSVGAAGTAGQATVNKSCVDRNPLPSSGCAGVIICQNAQKPDGTCVAQAQVTYCCNAIIN